MTVQTNSHSPDLNHLASDGLTAKDAYISIRGDKILDPRRSNCNTVTGSHFVRKMDRSLWVSETELVG